MRSISTREGTAPSASSFSLTVGLHLVATPHPLPRSQLLPSQGGANYNYIQGSLSSIDVDVLGYDIDGDGYSGTASVGLSENVAAQISVGTAEYDYDIDIDSFSLGLLFHTPVSDRTEAVFGISYISQEVFLPMYSEDDTSNSITVGIRHFFISP